MKPDLGCRILVYGVTGAGKSTAAQRIAARTGLPLMLADELTWEPGWVSVSEDEQRRRFAAVAAQDRWVLDTGHQEDQHQLPGWPIVSRSRCYQSVGMDPAVTAAGLSPGRGEDVEQIDRSASATSNMPSLLEQPLCRRQQPARPRMGSSARLPFVRTGLTRAALLTVDEVERVW